jgi:glycosyltransferase involved in cell wall biosynthesis
MRIDVVFPVLPPTIDGIGDHTALLCRALAEKADVRILTAQEEYVPIPGVTVERGFTTDRRSGVLRLVGAVRSRKPDWVFLQFNQFSYGRWGLNPFLPAAMRRIKESVPGTRIAWMVHEDYMPPTSFKRAVMSMWQRAQFRQLGNAAHVIFFSIEPWVEQYGSWFPDARIEHLPVGSNIPDATMTRAESRTRIGVDDGVLLLGYFGAIRGDRRFDAVAALVHATARSGREVRLLYVGPDVDRAQAHLGSDHLITSGWLEPQEAANRLMASDILIAPYSDGASSRRGGFLAGLQLGLATLGNVGPLTDVSLAEKNGSAFLLAQDATTSAFVEAGMRLVDDPELRNRLGVGAEALFAERYAWSAIARSLYRELR